MADHEPRPVQQPRVPLLIGGSGDRPPRLTAERADITAFAGARTGPGSTTGQPAPVTTEQLDERVGRYREFAAGREERAELNLLPRSGVGPDDPEGAVRPALDRVPDLTTVRMLEFRVRRVRP
jgi:alkanesulfonate monooxygenase SsuD/methylene tetrahydromethanopterin reductase-like flavin-dependent oxidoreductase (luciferase family)